MGWSPWCYLPSFVKIDPQFWRRRFLKGFYHMWRGGHLGHVTQMPRTKFCSPYSRKLYIKLGQAVSEKEMFEHCGRRRRTTTTDAGPWVYYKLTYALRLRWAKNLSYQILPCRKIGQGHSRVIIWTNYDVLESPKLHTNFHRNLPAGSGKKDFRRVFTIYEHCGHLGHVTSIMSSYFHFLEPERFHKKSSSDRHSSFWENPVWIFVCTRPWAKVKKGPWPSILTYLHIFN